MIDARELRIGNIVYFNNYEQLDINQIKTDKDKLRSFYPITDTYYLETNIDSNTKFSRLKKVLTAFELEDELIIKYE